ncbi:MAG: DNA replication/repair protein RecF, partial [Nevskiales bacterium]
VQYYAGWAQGVALAEALAAGTARDREAGHTGVGPHRADLRLKLQGVPVPERASRGEQKLVTAALLLAQAREVHTMTARRPILLIDDLAAELGPHYREWLLRQIEALGMQAFLTFLQERDIPQRDPGQAMFHVEHGRLKRAA